MQERSSDKYSKGMPNPTSKKIQRAKVSFSTSDRATRRVIAPYVKIIRKGQKPKPPPEDTKFSYYLQKKPSALMRNLTNFFSDSVDLPSVFNETSEVLKNVTRANGVTLYMVDEAQQEIYQIQNQVTSQRHKVNWKIEGGKTIAAFVAYKKEYVMIDDILGDERFPLGIGHQDQLVKSVMCVPVCTPECDCLAVIELFKDVAQAPFQKDDLRVVIAVTGWMGAALHQNQQRVALQKQQQLNDYLLGLTKCYFADVVLMEKMISEIVGFAKITLGAERGSFFIIDKESDELVADLFDEGIESDRTDLHKKHIKVRMGKERGIAGLVASTGETVNIKDAYNDARFNKEVDQRTGFITRSILCMPIMGVDGILGVVQVVNKKNGPCFTNTDENLFKTFSVYCALALHYSKLESQMNKVDKTNTCFLNLLKANIKPCCHDVKEFIKKGDNILIPELITRFEWYITPDALSLMPQLSLHMFVNIIGHENLNIDDTIQFILSVKKSYRDNPYHNFEHAFNVCHCMFNMLNRNMDQFSAVERKSLIVAALCHDLDHAGFTNNFLTLVNDNLVQLYEESPLENHHYQVTMIILGTCNIFKRTTAEEFKKISSEIKDAILATDLAMYFRSRTKLIQICSEDVFNWDDSHHRFLLKSIMMTCADLSGQCKPFPIARKLTDNLYREFYNQGDIEKTMGLLPLSMMDREKQYMVPEDQVQFLTVVVKPCTELLKLLLANTEELYDECEKLRRTWLEIIDLRGQRCWSQDKSLVKSEQAEHDNK